MKTTIDMAREAGWTSYDSQDERFKAFEALVRADEREACAKFFEGKVGQADLRDIAAFIRARSCPPCNDDCDQGRNCPARSDK